MTKSKHAYFLPPTHTLSLFSLSLSRSMCAIICGQVLPLCRDDLVVVPKKSMLRSKLPGIHLVVTVSSVLHLIQVWLSSFSFFFHILLCVLFFFVLLSFITMKRPSFIGSLIHLVIHSFIQSIIRTFNFIQSFLRCTLPRIARLSSPPTNTTEPPLKR